VVTVALDVGGAEAARPFIERAQATHPSLIDARHELDEKFGVVNIPNSVWIDEEGVIVRPAEPAHVRIVRGDTPIREDLPPLLRDMLEEARKIVTEPERYVAALRDWVEKGAESPYALSPDEVIERSGPRGREEAEAAAHFELAQHLHRTGEPEAAVPHFREAHRLQPENWTYKRQAWTFADPLQGPSDVYDGDWLSEVRKVGAENYYPPLRM
jgi:hypothetical protein